MVKKKAKDEGSASAWDLVPAGLETLENGSLLRRANAAIRSVYQDVRRRSNVAKARTVLVEVKIAPLPIADGGYVPHVECTVRERVPASKGEIWRCEEVGGELMVGCTRDGQGELPYMVDEDTGELCNVVDIGVRGQLVGGEHE